MVVHHRIILRNARSRRWMLRRPSAAGSKASEQELMQYLSPGRGRAVVEDMAEVTAAASADDLGAPHEQAVGPAANSTASATAGS